MAVAGFGYWALVAAAIVSPAIITDLRLGDHPLDPGIAAPRSWNPLYAALWRHGHFEWLSRLCCLQFGKGPLGRFWGADALGMYGRAYQLINIPTENLNSAIGGVAFSALSRLQNDPVRLRSYFLKGYSLVISMTLPTTIFCALFADDIVLVVLGPKWTEAAVIFRLLTPTILIFGIINPMGWLLFSIGLQVRSLKIALVIAPLVITAYVIGLPFGPSGSRSPIRLR